MRAHRVLRPGGGRTEIYVRTRGRTEIYVGSGLGRVDGFAGLDDEVLAVGRDFGGTFGPEAFGDGEPFADLLLEAALAFVVGHAHLLFEAARAAEVDVFGSRGFEAAPGEPHIEIEITGGVGEAFDDFGVDGDGVALDLLPEGLAEFDDVFELFGGKRVLIFVAVEPELHAVEVVEARPVEDEVLADVAFGSEEDGGGEDALEAFDETAVVGSGFLEAEGFEHFAGGAEADGAAVLAEGERGDPDGDDAVLAEGEAEAGMAGEAEEEFAVLAGVFEGGFRDAADGKAAKDEGAGVEDEILLPFLAFGVDDFDGGELFGFTFRDGDSEFDGSGGRWMRERGGRVGGVGSRWQGASLSVEAGRGEKGIPEIGIPE